MKNLQEFVDLPKVFDSNSVQLLLLFFLRRNPLHANEITNQVVWQTCIKLLQIRTNCNMVPPTDGKGFYQSGLLQDCSGLRYPDTHTHLRWRALQYQLMALLLLQRSPSCSLFIFSILFLEVLVTPLGCVFYSLKRESVTTFRSSHSLMFFKIGVLKSFPNFKGKRLSWSLFFVKLQASGLQLY